jgi:hypothetical protein
VRARTGRRQHGIGGHDARALTRACWALNTSSVVRWPTRAASRTPLSATSAAVTCDWAASICAFGGLELPPGLGHVRLHLVVSPWLAGWPRIRSRPDSGTMSWAAIEACNCSSTAIDCVEPKFFCTLPTAANAGTSAPSAQLPARFEPPAHAQIAPPSCPSSSRPSGYRPTRWSLGENDTFAKGRECLRATPMEKLQSGGLLVP